jgi:hypothetical protein
MELFWADNEVGELRFPVHLKPNQHLKYLNRDSTHTTACFKAIPSGVYNRLAKLTTILPENAGLPIGTLYPKHHQQLQAAELVSKPIPTLEEEMNKYREANNPQKKADKH